jgi:hypothetical protein
MPAISGGRLDIFIMDDRIVTGGDIDSYCTKCRLNLGHTVVAMVGGAVVKVKCKTCGSIHKFRDMTPQARTLRRKEPARPKSHIPVQALWETAVEGAAGPDLPYDMSSQYKSGDVIMHSVFGKGIVQKTAYKKCAVLFRDKERVLATSNT